MTAKTRNGIISVSIVLVLGAGAWFAFRKKKLSKAEMVKFIYENEKTLISKNAMGYAATVEFYMNTGDDYIAAWYKALTEGKDSFTHDGNIISIQTGRAIGKAN